VKYHAEWPDDRGTNELLPDLLRDMSVILTVEDEFHISEYLNTVLTDSGHEVIATADANEAIAVLETRRDIRIMITDINMPGSMDGLKLAAAVRGRWPPIRIIVATGKGRPADHQMPEHSQFLAKPYSPTAVLAAVRASI
jgi:two-component system, response regulator PdtaR